MSNSSELDRFVIVLVAARNPNNIGAAARAMSNFGFRHLRVVNPYEVAFQEARSAVGASAVLASTVQFPTVAEAIADCTFVLGTTAVGEREPAQPVVSLDQIAPLLQGQPRTALLFGSEKTGLSNSDLSHCHQLVRIPTRDEHISMNLGQAVAVCLYEIVRAPELRATTPPRNAATVADLERLTNLLREALNVSGYDQAASAATEQKLRSLVLRLAPSAHDSDALHGMLRQILWKLKK